MKKLSYNYETCVILVRKHSINNHQLEQIIHHAFKKLYHWHIKMWLYLTLHHFLDHLLDNDKKSLGFMQSRITGEETNHDA